MSLYITRNILLLRRYAKNEKAPSGHSLNIIMQVARNSYWEKRLLIPDKLLFKS
jgi:hypothetical protein